MNRHERLRGAADPHRIAGWNTLPLSIESKKAWSHRNDVEYACRYFVSIKLDGHSRHSDGSRRGDLKVDLCRRDKKQRGGPLTTGAIFDLYDDAIENCRQRLGPGHIG